MQRSLPFFIGLRFVRSKNANKFLSFISLVSMAGLVLGVAALIVVTSVLNGFEQALSSRVLGMVPQVAIYSSQPLDDWQLYARRIQDNDANVIGTAPFVQARGMLSLNGEVSSTIINGIEPKSNNDVSILDDSMILGNTGTLESGSNNIILGKYIVDQYGLNLGDDINIIIAKPSDSATGIKPVFHTYTLTGVFHVSKELDKWMSYVAIDDASEVLGMKYGAIGIRLNLKDVFSSQHSAETALNSVSNSNSLEANAQKVTFLSGDWTQSHGSLYSAIRLQKTIMSLLLLFIVLVAAFNVISMLVMSVTEKKADIAILKTFGASDKLISRIFMVQGAVIGAIGISVGLVLGIAISLSVEGVSAWVDTTFSLGLFNNYFVEALPAKIQVLDVLIIVILAFAIVILSTIYPARKAAKLRPVNGLKGE